MMDNTQIVSLIANYGVPSALTVYLVLWITRKLNSKLDNLANEIKQLNETMGKFLEIIERVIEKSKD